MYNYAIGEECSERVAAEMHRGGGNRPSASTSRKKDIVFDPLTMLLATKSVHVTFVIKIPWSVGAQLLLTWRVLIALSESARAVRHGSRGHRLYPGSRAL